MVEYRSYHGPDTAKAIQFYWPRVLPDEAEKLSKEMNAINWDIYEGKDRSYQQARWLARKLGT